MELVSPAGNADKLYYAYLYGADAAYIGLKRFSLRMKADNFQYGECGRVSLLKKRYPGKKLFCALNITFHDSDIEQFIKEIDSFKQYPIDAFIVQDLGVVPVIQKYFPDVALHLSTQANCVNSGAAKVYKDMGFKRIVLGRETTLDEIRRIKDAVPDVELECFAHGAMCIAYSGRCLMSAYMTGRSANSGMCTQPCRWNYKTFAESGTLSIQEKERPAEYFPIYEGDNFTAVLSSKDLCMAEHMEDMKKAGVDAIKIEGRMKSVYYTALVTRAYRKALDALEGKIKYEDAAPFISELDNVSHRESSTGFYYGRNEACKTARDGASSPYILAAAVGKSLCLPAHTGKRFYILNVFNKIDCTDELELVSPSVSSMNMSHETWNLADSDGNRVERLLCCRGGLLCTSLELEEGALIRIKTPCRK